MTIALDQGNQLTDFIFLVCMYIVLFSEDCYFSSFVMLHNDSALGTKVTLHYKMQICKN